MRLLVITQKVDREDENLGFFHRWLEEFAAHYDEIVVIANRTGTHALPSRIALYALEGEKKQGKVRKIMKFWELFSKHYASTDAVFFHMIPEYVIAATPFLFAKKKPSLLWYVHKSVTWKLKWAERMVGYIGTASHLSFRLPSKKVVYTGHAIDTDMFKPLVVRQSLPTGLRLLTVGRISPVKELETIIHACVMLKSQISRPWSLSVVGGPLMPRDHDYFTTLKTLVQERGLGSYIHFYGSRPHSEIPALYHEHDIFISTSTTGSLDKAVLEAMASGLTVITANEAFQPILPAKYFLEQRSDALLAARIKMLADEERPNGALRACVVAQHSLKNTIAKICSLLRVSI